MKNKFYENVCNILNERSKEDDDFIHDFAKPYKKKSVNGKDVGSIFTNKKSQKRAFDYMYRKGQYLPDIGAENESPPMEDEVDYDIEDIFRNSLDAKDNIVNTDSIPHEKQVEFGRSERKMADMDRRLADNDAIARYTSSNSGDPEILNKINNMEILTHLSLELKLAENWCSNNKPLMIYGDPGIGKTEVVIDLGIKVASELGRAYANWNDIKIDDKRLMALNGEYLDDIFILTELKMGHISDPESLSGIPKVNNDPIDERKYDGVVLTLTNKKTHGILFLDEFNHANHEVKNMAYDLINKKQFPGNVNPCPDSIKIFAAGNIVDCNEELSSILTDRFSTSYLVANPVEWFKYAKENGIDPTILSFIRDNYLNNYEIFYQNVSSGYDPSSSEGKRAPGTSSQPVTPRSIMAWSKVLQKHLEKWSEMTEKDFEKRDEDGVGIGDGVDTKEYKKYLKTYGGSPNAGFYSAMRSSAASHLGVNWAEQFMSYYETYKRFNVDQFIKDPEGYDKDNFSKNLPERENFLRKMTEKAFQYSTKGLSDEEFDEKYKEIENKLKQEYADAGKDITDKNINAELQSELYERKISLGKWSDDTVEVMKKYIKVLLWFIKNHASLAQSVKTAMVKKYGKERMAKLGNLVATPESYHDKELNDLINDIRENAGFYFKNAKSVENVLDGKINEKVDVGVLYNLILHKRIKMLTEHRTILASDPKYAYLTAKNILKDSFKEAEVLLSVDSKYCALYEQFKKSNFKMGYDKLLNETLDDIDTEHDDDGSVELQTDNFDYGEYVGQDNRYVDLINGIISKLKSEYDFDENGYADLAYDLATDKQKFKEFKLELTSFIRTSSLEDELKDKLLGDMVKIELPFMLIEYISFLSFGTGI